MPSKRDVEKRRVAAARADEAAERAAGARARKRRRTIGALSAFLALALIIPLAGGIVVALWPDNDDPETSETDDPTAAVLREVPPGATLSGPTPCPETDGSQERTTSFEEPPEMCIDPEVPVDVVLTTDLGDVTIAIDPTIDPVAANLFVTNVRYGIYDDVPFVNLFPDGLAVVGDPLATDAGFTVEPSGGTTAYEPGDVTLFAGLDGTVATRFAVITTDLIADAFAADPSNPTIGRVTDGLDVIDAVMALAGSPETAPAPVLDLRVSEATVVDPAAPAPAADEPG